MKGTSAIHSSYAAAAVRNNALWCDTICRAHALPTTLDHLLWRCLRPAPPFYPNVVTLTPDARAAQTNAITALVDSGLTGAWAVKDSFAVLDLAPLGFAPLFDATWIAHASGAPRAPCAGLRWLPVRTAQELARWERAWTGEEPPAAPLFLPALLNDPTIVFLAGYRETALVAGGILNRTGAGAEAVVGLSNTFAAPDEDEQLCWLEVAAQAAQHAPEAALVGYEHGDSLAWALDAGFTALHPLRIWAGVGEL